MPHNQVATPPHAWEDRTFLSVLYYIREIRCAPAWHSPRCSTPAIRLKRPSETRRCPPEEASPAPRKGTFARAWGDLIIAYQDIKNGGHLRARVGMPPLRKHGAILPRAPPRARGKAALSRIRRRRAEDTSARAWGDPNPIIA